MSYVEFDNKEVKCRKFHTCEWCAGGIEKGERAHTRSGIWDDGPFTAHSHIDCWQAMEDSDLGDLYEWMPGDFKRGEVYKAYTSKAV